MKRMGGLLEVGPAEQGGALLRTSPASSGTPHAERATAQTLLPEGADTTVVVHALLPADGRFWPDGQSDLGKVDLARLVGEIPRAVANHQALAHDHPSSPGRGAACGTIPSSPPHGWPHQKAAAHAAVPMGARDDLLGTTAEPVVGTQEIG
jgi:hypothetical protein